ncbi:MAG: hypothetical protein A2Z83_02885 [Omnitrophica bacterium GWA2_52_8]|nr:MAG: hypothetical protein A2Z83_02885 [Omnitrophica bacterium GWA2_52_8]
MPKKILIIDDEEILIKTLLRLFEKNGYEAAAAMSGDEALRLAEENGPFDLVVCDMRMPGYNGVELIKRMEEVYSARYKCRVPVIFLTGFADETLEAQAQLLNPVAYMYKPFDISELFRQVHETVSK